MLPSRSLLPAPGQCPALRKSSIAYANCATQCLPLEDGAIRKPSKPCSQLKPGSSNRRSGRDGAKSAVKVSHLSLRLLRILAAKTSPSPFAWFAVENFPVPLRPLRGFFLASNLPGYKARATVNTQPKLAIFALFAAILLGVLVLSLSPASPLIAIGYEHKGVYPAQESGLFVATNLTDRPVAVSLSTVEFCTKGVWRDGNKQQMVFLQLGPRSKHVFSVPMPDGGERWRVRMLTTEEKKGLRKILGRAQYIWQEVIHGRGFKVPPALIIDTFKTNTCEFPF